MWHHCVAPVMSCGIIVGLAVRDPPNKIRMSLTNSHVRFGVDWDASFGKLLDFR